MANCPVNLTAVPVCMSVWVAGARPVCINRNLSGKAAQPSMEAHQSESLSFHAALGQP